MMMLFILAISMIVAMMFAAIILMIEESASKRLNNQKSAFDLRSVRRVARGTRSKHITHAWTRWKYLCFAQIRPNYTQIIPLNLREVAAGTSSPGFYSRRCEKTPPFFFCSGQLRPDWITARALNSFFSTHIYRSNSPAWMWRLCFWNVRATFAC